MSIDKTSIFSLNILGSKTVAITSIKIKQNPDYKSKSIVSNSAIL